MNQQALNEQLAAITKRSVELRLRIWGMNLRLYFFTMPAELEICEWEYIVPCDDDWEESNADIKDFLTDEAKNLIEQAVYDGEFIDDSPEPDYEGMQHEIDARRAFRHGVII